MYTTKAFEGGTDARSKLNYSMSDLATADRATVEERLAAGESAEEAEAEFRPMRILRHGTRASVTH